MDNAGGALTVKELAEELSVSVQTVYRRLKKIDPLGEYTFEEAGITRITSGGAELIKNQGRGQGGVKASPGPDTGQIKELDPATRELIDAQRAHIETLTKQIESLNRQIEQDKHIRLLEAESRQRELNALNESSNIYTGNVKEVKERKAPLWQRFKDIFKSDN